MEYASVLRKVQARQAFSSYLSRVQYRLMAESEKRSKESPELVLKQEEQMVIIVGKQAMCSTGGVLLLC